MAYGSEKEEYYNHKFDGTNFTIQKEQMMDVLTNKCLIEPLYERWENVGYKDAQQKLMDAKAKATMCLHLAKSIFFTIIGHTTTKQLWDNLCSN